MALLKARDWNQHKVWVNPAFIAEVTAYEAEGPIDHNGTRGKYIVVTCRTHNGHLVTFDRQFLPGIADPSRPSWTWDEVDKLVALISKHGSPGGVS